MKKRLLWVFLFMAFSPASMANAFVGLCCSHCGGNMPLNIIGAGIPQPFEFRFKFSQMYMNMEGLRNGTNDITRSKLLGMPAMGKYMAAPKSMDMHMSMFGMAYSFTDDLALMAMFMGSRNRMPMEFSTMMKMSTGVNGFTMESEGLNDTTLLAKYRLYADDDLYPTSQLSLLFGANLPTGSISEKFNNHPVAANNSRLLPFGMQLGTGTVDPILGISYQGSSDPFWYGVNLRYTGRWYDNSRGYHKGQEFDYDIFAMYQPFANTVLHVQLNGKNLGRYSNEPDRQRNNGDGHVMYNPSNGFMTPLFDPHNYGGYKLYFTAGVQFQPFPLHIMELSVQVPIHQDLNGPQLKEDFMVRFTYYFELPTKKSRRYVGAKPPKEMGF